MSSLHFDVVDDTAGLDALAGDWRRLERDHAGDLQLFQAHDWNRCWWEHFAAAGRLHVVTGRSDGRLVLLWPGIVTRRGPLRVLESMGGLLTCYDDVLIAGDIDAAATLQAFAGHLGRSRGFDLWLLKAVHAEAGLAALGSALGRTVSQTAAPFVDCSSAPDFAAYLAGRKKKMRQDQRRSWRSLARLGALEVVVDDRSLEPAVAARAAIDLKRVWLHARGLPAKDLFSDRGRAFLADVCAALAGGEGRGRLCLTTLRVAGNLASIGIGFRFGRRHYEYVGAFDYRLDQHGPGRVRMEATIRDCFARGLAAYDMLTPATRFKSIWTDRAPQVRQTVRPRTLAGRGYGRLYLATLRPLLKAAAQRLPRRLRRWALSTAGAAGRADAGE